MERQPTFSFSKVLGAVLLPRLSLLPPPSMLLRLGVRRAHRHDDSARLRRPLRPRGHLSKAPVLLLPLLRVKLLNNLHVFDKIYAGNRIRRINMLNLMMIRVSTTM